MKPTDEERREVAARLRNMCCCGCRYAEQFYELLKEKVMNSWDFHEYRDVAERLADLIEPGERTCCDEERREVAKRLRGIEAVQFDEGELVDCGEVEAERGWRATTARGAASKTCSAWPTS